MTDRLTWTVIGMVLGYMMASVIGMILVIVWVIGELNADEAWSWGMGLGAILVSLGGVEGWREGGRGR